MKYIFPVGLLLLAGVITSCLKNKPDSLPEKLEWNPELAFPLGMDRFGLNAASGFDTTLFELDTLTNLPRWLGRVEVVMKGRLPFNLSGFETTIENINQILFRSGISNGFPNEVIAQAYFVDEFLNPIDSMFSEGAIPIPAGTPFGEGDSIIPAVVWTDAIFDQERLNPLQVATEIILRATLPDPEIDTALIPFYPSYYIDMEVGVMVDLTIEL